MCLWGSSTPIFHTQHSYTQTSLPYTLSLSLSLALSLSLSFSFSLDLRLTHIDSPTLSTLCLSASLRHSQPSDIHSLCTLSLSQTLTPFRHPFLMYSLSLSDSHTFQTSIPYVLSVSLRHSHLSHTDIHSLCTLCLSQTLTPFRHPFLMYSLSLSDSHTFQTSIPYVLVLSLSLSLRHTSFTLRHPFLMYSHYLCLSQTHIFHTQTSIPYVLSLSLSLSGTHLSHADIHSLCTLIISVS